MEHFHQEFRFLEALKTKLKFQIAHLPDMANQIMEYNLVTMYNLRCRWSDHRYLKFTLNFNKLERDDGYQKMNVSYLENEDYIQGDQQHTTFKMGVFEINVQDYSINLYAKQSIYNVKQKIKIIEDRIILKLRLK